MGAQFSKKKGDGVWGGEGGGGERQKKDHVQGSQFGMIRL